MVCAKHVGSCLCKSQKDNGCVGLTLKSLGYGGNEEHGDDPLEGAGRMDEEGLKFSLMSRRSWGLSFFITLSAILAGSFFFTQALQSLLVIFARCGYP